MEAWKKVALFLLGILLVGVFFWWYPPDQIVQDLGVGNVLVVAGLVSFLGGVSTLTSASYYGVIGGFALAGVPIWQLMLVSGPMLLLGDLVFYYFGTVAHDALPDRIQRRFNVIREWLQRQPKWVVQVFVVLYTGFSPFPGDVLMIILALSHIKMRHVIIALLLGNMGLVWTISWLALGGEQIFSF